MKAIHTVVQDRPAQDLEAHWPVRAVAIPVVVLRTLGPIDHEALNNLRAGTVRGRLGNEVWPTREGRLQCTRLLVHSPK